MWWILSFLDGLGAESFPEPKTNFWIGVAKTRIWLWSQKSKKHRKSKILKSKNPTLLASKNQEIKKNKNNDIQKSRNPRIKKSKNLGPSCHQYIAPWSGFIQNILQCIARLLWKAFLKPLPSSSDTQWRWHCKLQASVSASIEAVEPSTALVERATGEPDGVCVVNYKHPWAHPLSQWNPPVP